MQATGSAQFVSGPRKALSPHLPFDEDETPVSRAVRLAERTEGRLTLTAPSGYHASYVERTYGDAIRRAVLAADA